MDKIDKRDIRALVVDDNEVNRIILVNMLELFHVQADQADSGRKAVLLNEEKAYDLILVDHIMPEMNGINTTLAIRRSAVNKKNAVIIALTADVTESIKYQYRDAGANAVYPKPIELKDLSAMFRTWGLEVQQEATQRNNGNNKGVNNELFKSIIETIDDIDYETGLKYAIGNPSSYKNILEVSFRDLGSCIIIIVNSFENNTKDELKMGVHKLRNVLANIGAIRLAEQTARFEAELYQLGYHEISVRYQVLLANLSKFEQKLGHALERCKEIDFTMNHEVDREDPMSPAEYEQSLQSTIYYIRRYEFEAIVRELDNLIRKGLPRDREILESAMKDIRDYDYDAAETRLIRIKNKTDH